MVVCSLVGPGVGCGSSIEKEGFVHGSANVERQDVQWAERADVELTLCRHHHPNPFASRPVATAGYP